MYSIQNRTVRFGKANEGTIHEFAGLFLHRLAEQEGEIVDPHIQLLVEFLDDRLVNLLRFLESEKRRRRVRKSNEVTVTLFVLRYILTAALYTSSLLLNTSASLKTSWKMG